MKVQWQVTGGRSGGTFFEMIRALGVRILTNTAGCHSVAEAVLTARIARELFATDWIKLEVIGNHDTLQPDVFGPVEAARIAKVSKSSRTHQFFLIVDSAEWIARLVPLGVKLVQWRIKDRPETELCTDYK